MSDDVLVKVENVSKRFCRSLKRSLWYGLQDLGSEIGGRRRAALMCSCGRTSSGR
jgi:lipopolysaccharide transport system ATP-binding protein